MIALLPPLIVLIAVGLYFYFTRWRDQWVRSRPFPAEWLSIIEYALPLYASLSAQEQKKLQQLMLLFIARKRFYGCNGLTITDEIRISIAAQACLLLVNHGWAIYPKLQSILVYPTAFRVEREQQQADGTVARAGHNLLGESWE